MPAGFRLWLDFFPVCIGFYELELENACMSMHWLVAMMDNKNDK